MARGRTPKGFRFSRHPGHGSARRTAGAARKQFKRISRKSPGGTTNARSSARRSSGFGK
jgi:hypothetical protein